MVRHRVLVSTFLGSNPSGPVCNSELVKEQQLFLFDFDGVIVDGINEYWQSALLTCETFLNSPKISIKKELYKTVSNTFKEIRPWVKYGWEMVIIVHEILKKENPLKNHNKNNFINEYNQNCQNVLHENYWLAKDIQKFLDESRNIQIKDNFEMWVKLHKPFYEVINFIEKLKKEKIKTGIITTKGQKFAEQILEELKIYPEFVFGYESGTKIEIIKKLSSKYKIIGFLEDRKKTLIDLKQNYDTKNIPCFLAEWGYLQNTDRYELPYGITLLKLKDLENILAN